MRCFVNTEWASKPFECVDNFSMIKASNRNREIRHMRNCRSEVNLKWLLIMRIIKQLRSTICTHPNQVATYLSRRKINFAQLNCIFSYSSMLMYKTHNLQYCFKSVSCFFFHLCYSIYAFQWPRLLLGFTAFKFQIHIFWISARSYWEN